MALDHYVSQVHLRNFYSPALGRLLYAYRKSDQKRFTPNSGAICRLEEGSTNDYLTEPRAIERFLKTIEGKYNAAVADLQEGRVGNDTIYVIAGFVCFVMTCSPAAMRIFSAPLRGAVQMTAAALEKSGQIPPPPPELVECTFNELVNDGRVAIKVDGKYPQAIGIANIMERIALFGNFPWEVLFNDHPDCPFFTSDYPVAIEETADPRVVNRIVPLTPYLALRIRPHTRLNRKLATLDFPFAELSLATPTRHQVVELNRMIVRSAEDLVLYRDDAPWVTPFLEKNTPFRIEVANHFLEAGDQTMQVSRQAVVPFNPAPASPPPART